MLNKVILIGRLGRDPETRFMPNDEAVCNFSVATSESWKDQSGQRQERIEWHNITMYRRLAEIAGQYLKKGSQVYLEGKIQSRKYQGNRRKAKHQRRRAVRHQHKPRPLKMNQMESHFSLFGGNFGYNNSRDESRI